MAAKLVIGALPAMRSASSIAFASAGAGFDDVVGKSERSAFFGPVGAPGQHHVDDPGGADQPRQAHRSAAAEENAAAAFRQGVIGRALRDPDVARGGKLEAAAHHRAMQRRHHRDPAEFDALEGAMPRARMRDPGRDVALGQLGEIEPGAEMLAFAVKHDGLDVIRNGGEEIFDAPDGGVVERVALVRARQAQDADSAVPLETQRRGELDPWIGRRRSIHLLP